MAEKTRAAIWARVSTAEQHTENQLGELRQWAADRGLEVAAEFTTEDSAWQNGNGPKGREFDRARRELLDGAQLGRYDVILVWAVDRLSRRGIEDTLATMRQVYERGADIWSRKEPWLVTSEPRIRELLVSFMAWMAEQESARRSERTRAGMARARAEGKRIGGRKTGAKDKARRRTDGYSAAWTPERRAALAERNRARARPEDTPPS